MKNRIFLVLSILLCTTTAVWAHTPLLMLEDNEDGTLTVEGGYSTGAGAAGVDLYVKTKMDRTILLQERFPESSILEIEIPNEPYYLVFDGGPGHKVVKDGPPPPDGFTVNEEAVSMKLEKSDASGIAIPKSVIFIIVIVAAFIVFVIPKISKKKKQ